MHHVKVWESIRRLSAACCLLTIAVAWAGCSRYSPPSFELNLEGRKPDSVSPLQRQVLEETLTDLFGTPDEPKVPEGVELDLEKLKRAAGPVGRDYDGVERGLFRKHCVTCHGISGDGAGPIAAMLTPYPRDFRWGIFKYTSTVLGAKPTRADLRKTLRRGLPGTAMPSFMGLSDDDLECLIEYVKYLSIRGETERYLVRLVVDENEPIPLDRELVMEEGVLPAAQSWDWPELDPETFVVKPERPRLSAEELAESIARGKVLYQAEKSQCVKCHGPEGHGDGEEKELYDDWNKPKKGVTPEQTAELRPLFKLPLQRLQARDFREGIFHGGGTPEDIYLRIYTGIKGTPMPAAGEAPGVPGALEPEEIWDIVHYVLSLSRTQVQQASPPDRF
ncbi:MAG: cytochrome c [Planctomycetota bacterium]|nr:MAG: cytochrome c [Planctomycetota bacterium]